MYLLNGECKHCIDISDRGFQYGDGLFETIEVLAGKPLFLDLHLKRMAEGCERLLIPMPAHDLLIHEAVTIAAHKDRAVLKMIITRGSGGRGYRQPDPVLPTRLFSVHSFPDYPDSLFQEGVSVRFCQQRLGLNSQLAGIKHLNRLEQVLARAEWNDPAIHEGLMLDVNGHVIEGTMSNVFFAKNKVLFTPEIKQSGVAGIIRSIVKKLAVTLAIEVSEKVVVADELLCADEIFLTNSIIGIWPVAKLGREIFNIGPVTRNIQAAYLNYKQQAVDCD